MSYIILVPGVVWMEQVVTLAPTAALVYMSLDSSNTSSLYVTAWIKGDTWNLEGIYDNKGSRVPIYKHSWFWKWKKSSMGSALSHIFMSLQMWLKSSSCTSFRDDEEIKSECRRSNHSVFNRIWIIENYRDGWNLNDKQKHNGISERQSSSDSGPTSVLE
jgi:hypothetical protein